MVLDFKEVPNTQFFYNRVGSEYPYATNGFHNHTDVYDMFYNPVRGFSSRYIHQKITLPTFREPIIERENFAIFIKFSVNNINVREQGNISYGLFHRFKYNGNNVVTKVILNLVKSSWSNSIDASNTINGRSSSMQTFGCSSVSKLISAILFSFQCVLLSLSATRDWRRILFLCL